MSSTPAWLSAFVFPLVVFIVGQLVYSYYGDRIKTWAAQRSVEKMQNRISQLQMELDEAREDYQSLSEVLWSVTNVVYVVAATLPTILIVVQSTLTAVFFDFTVDALVDSSFPLTNPYFYLTPYFIVLISLILSLYLTYSIFFTKPFRRMTKRLKNVAEYNDFKVQAEKTITHLEGRIRRLEK
jgi:uncharacterized membrane protein (DUF106 family)